MDFIRGQNTPYLTWRGQKITLEEICKRNFKYSLIKEYDLSNAPFISNFRVKLKKKKSIPCIYFGGESNPGIPTGGNPHHYTTEELDVLSLVDYVMGKLPISF